MGHNYRFPCVVQKIQHFLHFKDANVQKMQKVLLLIVLKRGTCTSNATIVINAALCNSRLFYTKSVNEI